MQILEQRFLRGPNIHADTPCLLSVLDLGDLYGVSTRDIPQFNEALLNLLPSLAEHLVPIGQPGGFAQRLREGTYLARVDTPYRSPRSSTDSRQGVSAWMFGPRRNRCSRICTCRSL